MKVTALLSCVGQSWSRGSESVASKDDRITHGCRKSHLHLLCSYDPSNHMRHRCCHSLECNRPHSYRALELSDPECRPYRRWSTLTSEPGLCADCHRVVSLNRRQESNQRCNNNSFHFCEEVKLVAVIGTNLPGRCTPFIFPSHTNTHTSAALARQWP